MPRFFVHPDILQTPDIHIRGDVAHQISRVLRMQAGDMVCLLDGSGIEHYVRLASIGKDELVAHLEERKEASTEPRHKVTLYMSLLNKADKFEWALQKATEIGAAGIVPVRATRSISDAPGRVKMERWARIIQEAAEQSGRAIVPTLADALPMQAALKMHAAHLAFIPEPDSLVTIKTALRNIGDMEPNTIAIFIGPEGGFTLDEVEQAKAAGVQPVSLGPRILRAETAAVAALTMAIYELEISSNQET